jgi:hypothetical protein
LEIHGLIIKQQINQEHQALNMILVEMDNQRDLHCYWKLSPTKVNPQQLLQLIFESVGCLAGKIQTNRYGQIEQLAGIHMPSVDNIDM